MRHSGGSFDYWKPAGFILWTVFFGAGLAPEWVFYMLRDSGGVATQRALTNSPYFITVGLAAYWGLFCAVKCRDAGRPGAAAQASGAQLGFIALMAFLPFPLELLVQAREIPIAQTRHLVYLVGFTKLLAWWYLWLLLLFYHVSGNPAVFCRTIWLFPSAYSWAGTEPRATPAAKPPDNAQNPSAEPKAELCAFPDGLGQREISHADRDE